MLPVLASCSKEAMPYSGDFSFSGSSYNGESLAQYYMTGLSSTLVVDNLLAIEDALVLDGLGKTTYREGGSFKPDGNSIWTVGATWEMASVQSIRGVKIIREAADSTWKMTYDGEYDLNGSSFPTRYELTLRMLPGSPSDHFDWETELSMKRTEDDGYSSEIVSVDKVRFVRTTSNFYTWGSCYGQFMMEVWRNGSMIDRALLTYNGNSQEYRYRRGL